MCGYGTFKITTKLQVLIYILHLHICSAKTKLCEHTKSMLFTSS
jgi:hypothetical protein